MPSTPLEMFPSSRVRPTRNCVARSFFCASPLLAQQLIAMSPHDRPSMLDNELSQLEQQLQQLTVVVDDNALTSVAGTDSPPGLQSTSTSSSIPSSLDSTSMFFCSSESDSPVTVSTLTPTDPTPIPPHATDTATAVAVVPQSVSAFGIAPVFIAPRVDSTTDASHTSTADFSAVPLGSAQAAAAFHSAVNVALKSECDQEKDP